MGEFRMPSLGADMESGTIVEWRVQPGDTVHRGDIVAVVDTDKSDIEVEVFEDGVVEQLLVAPDVEVPVGTVLALITSTSGTAAPAPAPTAPSPAAAATAAPPAAPPAAPSPAPEPLQTTPVDGDTRFVRASPMARREAARLGVDLGSLQGSGAGGAVVAADLADHPTPTPAAAPPPAPAPRSDRADDHRASMRQAIAGLMARSKRDIPHYYLGTSIDMAAALEWLTEHNAARSVTDRVLPAVLLLKATAAAAVEVPVMNGAWEDGFRPASTVDLGMAVALRTGGLVVPTLHDAAARSVDELMAELRAVVQRARAGGLRGSDLTPPSITVTNLGDEGVEDVFAVIYPPQVAMVGFGRIAERPWAVGGMLGVRPVVRASLAADHRASDGHDGARFLATVDHLLQNPEAL